MTFKEYLLKVGCSIRIFNAVHHYDINEKTDLNDLSMYRTIGKKSGPELIQLQKNYIDTYQKSELKTWKNI